MNFGGYVGAMTAISMINNHSNNERHKDVSVGLIEEDRVTDRVKEVVHSPRVNGIFGYTRGNLIVPSGKW